MAGNMQAGLSTGMQGAQMGGQVGGVWGAVIGGIGGFALGYNTPDYEKLAREKYNNEVVKNTVTALFDMRRVQNVENMRTAQALETYRDNQRVTESQYNAAFGAADIIGSSSEALGQTLDWQTDQAVAQTWLNYEIGIDNYNTAVEGTVNSAMAGLRRTKGATNSMDLGALTKSGISMYQQYGGQVQSAWSGYFGGGATSTQGISGGGLQGLSDFGSFGQGGSASGLTGGGGLSA